MDGFKLTSSTVAGYVLTSNSFGDGTWQPASPLWSASGNDVYYDTGNVGIGTPSPRTSLDTTGRISTGSSTTSSPGAITFFPPDANAWFHIDNGPAGGRPTGRLRISYGANPGDNEVMSIVQTGNVGIGTTDPGSHKLYVRSASGGAAGATVQIENDNATNGIALALDSESTDTTLLISNHADGDLIRGDSYVGGWRRTFTVSNEGQVTCSTVEITGGSDLSEQFDVRANGAEPIPGTVVCIDPDRPGKLVVSSKAYDRTVAGVVSGAGGIKPGMTMGQQKSAADGELPVALTGRVHVYADAATGPVQPGDLLTTSDRPGHAMKAADYAKAQGAILGKAMTPLEEGTGLVLVLVTLQ
jgi:hypothetical protein